MSKYNLITLRQALFTTNGSSNTTKYTIKNDLTKKREKKKKKSTHKQNGMYLSKLVIKQDMCRLHSSGIYILIKVSKLVRYHCTPFLGKSKKIYLLSFAKNHQIVEEKDVAILSM